MWPGGIEDFNLSGNATLSEHKYIGDDSLIVTVTHLDASRIQLGGMFPGKTGAQNMRALRALCVAPNPPEYKRLYLPGILPLSMRVVVDAYEFSRTSNDPALGNFGISYNITFARVGVLERVAPPLEIDKSQPQSVTTDRGDSTHVFIVKDGARTLRQISNIVYGAPGRWGKLYLLNHAQLSTDEVPLLSMATRLLPLGMKLKY